MAKLSKEELDQIKKLEKNLYNIRSKYGTIGDRLKYVEKQLFDAKEKEIPAVFHRKDRGEWFVTLSLEDFTTSMVPFKIEGNLYPISENLGSISFNS